MENMVSKGHRIYHPNVLLQEVVLRKTLNASWTCTSQDTHNVEHC
jgi:hypothetical protein